MYNNVHGLLVPPLHHNPVIKYDFIKHPKDGKKIQHLEYNNFYPEWKRDSNVLELSITKPKMIIIKPLCMQISNTFDATQDLKQYYVEKSLTDAKALFDSVLEDMDILTN